MTAMEPADTQSEGAVRLIYVLLALSYFTSAITGIIGVTMAYSKRSELAGTWFASHLNWQIRTFWISLVLIGIGAAIYACLQLALFLNITPIIQSLSGGPDGSNTDVPMQRAMAIIPWAVASLIVSYGVSFVWGLYRIVKGLIKLSTCEPIEGGLF
jgi:uncharacterized membrane protein